MIAHIQKLAFLGLLFTGACSMSNSKALEEFKSNITALLGDKESVQVVAGKLASFAWDTLCFERNDQLTLKFNTGEKTVTFEFDYTDYFVDEAYVAGSLDQQCITSADPIVIKKKYPGYSNTIEFLSAK
ncbi:MAG: hypothetical protein HC848_03815 [Limnobacter sp.]|nr:hypothetical protein [Limnobacter sp.]